jgi:subtilase family serine protease
MPRSRSHKRGRTRLATAAVAAAGTLAAAALSAAVGTLVTGTAATGATNTGSGLAAAEASAPPVVRIFPNVIRIPGAPRQSPLTTAECKNSLGIACYQPSQLRTAYHLPALYSKGITGKGETIAIVDSFGSPTIKSDLATFDKQFGIAAPPAFTIIAPAGKVPAFNAGNSDMLNWASETTLDVEYAHALAPGAKILLVETPVSETEGVTGFPQIVTAEKYVLGHYKVGVISQSFSATEETFKNYAQLAPLRAAYTEAYSHHVTVLAASGDTGATDYKSNVVDLYTRRVTSWPDSDPLVTAVGGTQLKQSGSGYTSVAWNDTFDPAWEAYSTGSAASLNATASGGGRSEFFARPSWQNGVKAITGAHRGVPDIAMSAACDGSVEVYSSFQGAGWSLICGTSEATPEFAAIVALADQVAGHPLGLINPKLYSLLARHAPGLVDVTSGNNTVSFEQGGLQTVTGYPARKGYDLVTGVGTVNAAQLVPELAG